MRTFSHSIGYKNDFISTDGHVILNVEIVEGADTTRGIFDCDFGAWWTRSDGELIDVIDMFGGEPGFAYEAKPYARYYSPWKCVYPDSCNVFLLNEGFSVYNDHRIDSLGVLIGKKSCVHMFECDWGPLYRAIAGGYGFKKESATAYEGFTDIARSYGYSTRTPKELYDILPLCTRQIYNTPGVENAQYADEMRHRLGL